MQCGPGVTISCDEQRMQDLVLCISSRTSTAWFSVCWLSLDWMSQHIASGVCFSVLEKYLDRPIAQS